MTSTTQAFLSFTATKCRDESGRLVLRARVHGGSFLYASIGLNGGCNIIARKLVGRYVLVTVGANGNIISFVAKIKARKRTVIAVAIPVKFRGMFERRAVVEIRLRLIDGDEQ
jgi:transcription antitermination factor NusG